MLVSALDAVGLSLDPPISYDAGALAVFSPSASALTRCRTSKEAELRAEVVSYRHAEPAVILLGCLQLRSGLVYWPRVLEVVVTHKQLDPLDRRDRALIAKRLSREMVRAARAGEAAALEATLDAMVGAQWNTMTAAEIDAVYAEVRIAVTAVGTTSAMRATTTRAGGTLLNVAEKSRRAKAFGIREAFLRADERAVKRMSSNMPFFVTNEYGRRVDVFVERDALAILQGGQRLGLDDVAIGRDLNRALAARVTGRTAAYFSSLSSISVVRASTFGQLTSYRDIGVASYEWVAVMDGATCNVCRMLHGEVFDTGVALAQLAAAEGAGREPDEAIMTEIPFYREHAGAIHIAPTVRGGSLGPLLARVTESAVGRDNEKGKFNIVRSPQGRGVTQSPPAHGNCRCLTLPKF
jgi:SPP1 gp7 family putative phage head morphogenesis protein